MKQNKNYPIDIVIPWVNGNDTQWQDEKEKFQKEESKSVHKFDYQDWGLLKYWFRGIEKNAPWIRYIYFITWGHIPEWLNTHHPKLKIVNHKDYIPQKYLPTFSSHTIELNIHRIEGLSEHFIYFNDDIFLINKTKRTDFFRKGLPCDNAVVNPIAPANRTCIASLQLRTASIINEHFKKNAVIRKNWEKWFTLKNAQLLPLNVMFLPWKKFPGLLEKHIPTSFLKSSFRKVWNQEYELLDQTCMNRFRNFGTDVNQWLIKEWQIAEGNFAPRYINVGKLCSISDTNSAKDAAKNINKNYKMICINDHVEHGDIADIQSIIVKEFFKKFPNKSDYEI